MNKRRYRVLVVEDDPKVVIFVEDILENMGFTVITARNGLDGLNKAQEEIPDLIILDVMMPGLDGYQVCQSIKINPKTQHIPILMLSAKGQLQDKVKGFDIGADDYLPKPYEKAEFEARVNALVKRSLVNPFSENRNRSYVNLQITPGNRINFRISGLTSLNGLTQNICNLDVDSYAYQGDITPFFHWRFNCKQWGRQLYKDVFITQPEIISAYNQSLGDVVSEGKLHLRIEGSRSLLRVPFEFMFDGTNIDQGDYVVLRHPFSRSITGIHIKKKPLSAEIFNEHYRSGESLRFLFVASNTNPPIPNVDEEIDSLSRSIREFFENKGLNLVVDVLSSDRASYIQVKKYLQSGNYHAFHYAGHGTYIENSPEKSFLSFWEKPNKQGKLIEMSGAELKMVIRDSNIRFAYLSCCSGSATAEASQLVHDDFLGILDSLIQAGVPSVLGFRWPVSDIGAREFAMAFYESLAKKGELDEALLDARCEIASRYRDDITWLSPAVISQV